MRLKQLLKATPVLALLVSASACDEGLTDVNKNPNSPEQVPAQNVLASGIWDAVSSNNGYGAFGEWSQLYHTELWAQHVAQAQYNDEDHYIPREGVPTAVWDVAYATALADLARAKEMAEEADDDNLWAVSEVMSVYVFLMLTDLFGDIPYTEALSLGENIQNPKYDTQATIYPDLANRLKAAVARINTSDNVDFENGDLIYEGDMAMWVRFANSLRMRVAMRMADTDQAAAARTAFAEAWAANHISSNDQIADLDWRAEQPNQNPIYEQIILGGRTGDFRVSATLVDTMKSLNDPRLPIYADPAQTDNVIRGLPNGLTPDETQVNGKQAGSSDYSWIGEHFLEPDAPSVLMSYAETLFLAAEAAQRGWIAGDAASLYRQAIAASMQQYGVAQSAIDAYLAQSRVQYRGLESIWLQKWLALYMAGPEAYNEYRRTRTPNLQLSAHAELDAIPARFPYPDEEALYNPTNFRVLELTDPMWWMKR